MIVPVRLRIIFLLMLLLQSPVARCEESRNITLYAVGDVMLGRYIAKVMTLRGSDYPFREISATLRRGDIVFGNLEAVISNDSVAPSYPEKPYNFHASKEAAQALKRAGFHVLNLANNHAMDFGPGALLETRRLLSEQGIVTMGAGNDLNEARRSGIVIKNGTRFGFLGYGVAHSRSVYATGRHAGIAPVVLEAIHTDILSLRKHADIVIVSLHWGKEYDVVPSRKQREEAHQIIDWGADMIIGHHPHVMQGIEIYKDRVIAYSLGNFIFDQKGKGTDRSFILACRFREKTLYSAEIIPLDRFRMYFPKVAEEGARKDILKELEKSSMPLHSQITVQEFMMLNSNHGEGIKNESR